MNTPRFVHNNGGMLEIDFAAVAGNWRRLSRLAKTADCAAVVKADAYGLGALPVASHLIEAGCRHFFVASLDEAVRLRDGLAERIKGRVIYILNGVMNAAEATEAAVPGMVPVLNHPDGVALWRQTAKYRQQRLPAALHVDTGMNRLGLSEAELSQLRVSPDGLDGLDIILLISHLACADQIDHPLNRVQLDRFSRWRRRWFPNVPASLANSAGILAGPEYHFDLVRPGATLYGVNPIEDSFPNPMRPVLRLSAGILQIREVVAGDSVGYGASHCFQKPARLATVGLGYGNGLPRSLSECGQAKIGGRWHKLLGRVSMDSCCIDITDLPPEAAHPGDQVVFLDADYDINNMAQQANIIAYELLCHLGKA